MSKTLNINYKTMEKKEIKKRKTRKKWDGTLKWERKTINDEPVIRFEINGYPFFLTEMEEQQLLYAIKDINTTAHFIISSVTE